VRVVIKVGGTLLEDQATRDGVAKQLAHVALNHALAVVHGGGKQVTRYLEDRGIQSRFVGGLRVSDDQVIEAVTNVIAGGINKHLVAALIAQGAAAVGISGVDGALTTAAPMRPELGYVGKPNKTNGALFDLLIGGKFIPVVACIAGDDRGAIYNVNADQMAVSCAVGWGADALIFLTDVDGVKDATGSVVNRLTADEAKGLIESGVAHGGMQAKLEAANTALEAGLPAVTIASGREADVCERLLAGEAIGTTLSGTPAGAEVHA
jgi:acetylglutamate kinase